MTMRVLRCIFYRHPVIHDHARRNKILYIVAVQRRPNPRVLFGGAFHSKRLLRYNTYSGIDSAFNSLWPRVPEQGSVSIKPQCSRAFGGAFHYERKLRHS